MISIKEFKALTIIIKQAAKLHGEDIIGIILKTSGHQILNDKEVVELANKIEIYGKEENSTKSS